MPNENEIRETLGKLPFQGRNVGDLNLIQSIKCDNHQLELKISAPSIGELEKEFFRIDIKKEINKAFAIDEIFVEFVQSKPPEINKVRHIIAVMSGKGGVGKSLASALTAISLKRLGYKVGILDADITGPSIPMMFNVHDQPYGDEDGLMPVYTSSGIAIMSINLILENEDDPVVWRGAMISKAINQFWQEVYWGKLDFLIVDLPPGTSDATLTVLKTLPTSGVIIVFTPQQLTGVIVKKAVKMARRIERPILGVIENMSYLYVPELARRFDIFGLSHAEEMAQEIGAPLIGKIPIDPTISKLCDEGKIEQYEGETVASLGQSVVQAIKAIDAAPTKMEK